jgi:uncharacterized protein
MKRRQFFATALILGAGPVLGARQRFAHGLLWRIARPGSAASHIYGTIHDADARLAELPAPVRRALEHARSLLVEFVPDSYSAARFTEAALFPDARTLEATIGADDFARVLDDLAPIGLERDFINKLKPWAALLNLRHTPATFSATPDAQVLARAREQRLPIAQMEDVEEQIFAFDECPAAAQVALLRHSLAHRAELLELESRTLDAYVQRDLGAIWRLREDFIARYPEVAPQQALVTKRLLYDRSVVMAYRMQRELRRGGAFVAIGALHLYGTKGVLALLEDDGFHAARVF